MALGLTTTLPLAATCPPLPPFGQLPTHVVAFVELHARVLLCPAVIDAGFATSDADSVGAALTVTVNEPTNTISLAYALALCPALLVLSVMTHT